MKKGTKFKLGGKDYAFRELTSGGTVVAYSYARKGFVKFKQSATREILNSESNEVDQKVVSLIEDEEKRRNDANIAAQTMKYGDRFIGADGNEYFFVKMNRSRFVLKKDLDAFEEFTAKPGFIKEAIKE